MSPLHVSHFRQERFTLVKSGPLAWEPPKMLCTVLWRATCNLHPYEDLQYLVCNVYQQLASGMRAFRLILWEALRRSRVEQWSEVESVERPAKAFTLFAALWSFWAIQWASFLCSLPAEKRTIPFSDIAERTKLDTDGVEFLLMKALSLKLIKGTIDEVQQNVQVFNCRYS